ncbi:unnamed protein product [Linum tenue]|uniref:AB hydrolase-1 domain-containing protein n=1 Tax=Linum tenue TaxID=586396 RepID=A0AAV0QJS4_9ROSI|nr:unnamed protein product [Linum tenue]
MQEMQEASPSSSKKISAAAARAHTRRNRATTSNSSIKGRLNSISAMFVPIAMALTVGALGWVYQSLKPPPPKICGSPGGPPITSPRVQLRDGRHLAYKEMGVAKEEAKHKLVIIHGFDNSKDINLPIQQLLMFDSLIIFQELMEELSLYVLTFDRAGYGESDPYPSRSVKSEAYDIEELADKLQIGSKFYVMGISMGAYPAYSCLKYIPHRLAGVALVVPFVHYWWPCLPANLSRDGLQKLLPMDSRAFRVAYYAPWLFHWWMTQKWFPSLSLTAGNMAVFCPQDMEMIAEMSKSPNPHQEKVKQQGVHESLYRDILAGYSKWEFDPTDLINPFPNNDGSVHIWQGAEDRIIPREINRYLAENIPWIQYHEVEDAGHLFIFQKEKVETVLRALVQD